MKIKGLFWQRPKRKKQQTKKQRKRVSVPEASAFQDAPKEELETKFKSEPEPEVGPDFGTNDTMEELEPHPVEHVNRVSMTKREKREQRRLRVEARKRQEAAAGETMMAQAETDGKPGSIIEGLVGGSVHGESIILESGSMIRLDVTAAKRFYGKMKTVVFGNVYAKEAVIEGTVRGDIEASQSVWIKAEGCVFGNITAPEIILDAKGYVAGNLIYKNK